MRPETSRFEIRPSQATDLPSVLDLLAQASLPLDDVAQWFEHFQVAHVGGRIIGAAGLEVRGGDGLLRSVVVDPAYRSLRAGQALVEAVLDDARRLGLRDIYLLTTTADVWFPRFGFRTIAREQASEAVRASVEFTAICSASAIVMVLAV
jgi:amino-acid N-acetyltransferase